MTLDIPAAAPAAARAWASSAALLATLELRLRAAVDVGVARLVLGEVGGAAAVTVGGGVVGPAVVVDRHAALPVAAGGAEVLGGPALVGLEVVREGDELDAADGLVEGRRSGLRG